LIEVFSLHLKKKAKIGPSKKIGGPFNQKIFFSFFFILASCYDPAPFLIKKRKVGVRFL